MAAENRYISLIVEKIAQNDRRNQVQVRGVGAMVARGSPILLLQYCSVGRERSQGCGFESHAPRFAFGFWLRYGVALEHGDEILYWE